METTKTFQIENMGSLRVARVSIKCENPEIAAYRALADWAKKNEPEPLNNVRFFGFNDPCPKPGQKIYVYEAWMTVSDKARSDGNVIIMNHSGGLYAVKHTPLNKIGEAWHSLSRDVKANGYKYGSGPALEEALTHPNKTSFDEAKMKLYFPIQR